jgi:TPR repeat protein
LDRSFYMKIFPLAAILVSAVLLEGCYAPVIEGAQQGYDYIRRDPLQAATAAGDAVAQYELGDTYCCHGGGPMDKVSIYDNDKATYWYCRAARQGYGPAQIRLARVYSGHPIHGLHIALRASALTATPKTDLSVALMWASVAVNHGADDATELRDQIMGQATSEQRARGSMLMRNWRAAPCGWAEVFPSASAQPR